MLKYEVAVYKDQMGNRFVVKEGTRTVLRKQYYDENRAITRGMTADRDLDYYVANGLLAFDRFDGPIILEDEEPW